MSVLFEVKKYLFIAFFEDKFNSAVLETIAAKHTA